MRKILVQPAGRMANQMIQRIIANTYERNLPNSKVLHPGMPHWQIKPSPLYKYQAFFFRLAAKLNPKTTFSLSGNEFKPIPRNATRVFLGGNGLRIEYLNPSHEFARGYFSINQNCQCCELVDIYKELENFNVIHVRLGDIWLYNKKTAVSYFPLPISFYEKVYSLCEKPFLVVSEKTTEDQDRYIDQIISVSPGSVRMAFGCEIRDFQLLRHAPTLTLATSTFSWLAAWLSEVNKELYIPKAGLFDSRARPDIDLLSNSLEHSTLINVTERFR